MKELILMNRTGSYAEILKDYDLSSFKYEYEINNERSISFTAYKASGNEDIFDMLVNENYIVYEGQYFVIKSTSLKYDSQTVLVEIVAKHIFMEFQNHFIDKDIESEELNTEIDDDSAPNYTLKQYLEFGFKNNDLGFEYEIIGVFNSVAPVSELGGQNGMEFIVSGAEYFNYIYFADNKKIYFYHPEMFYQRSDIPIIYRGNSDEMTADITTTDMKTYIRGFGKKKTKSETNNYNPIKPPDLKYNGNFFKEGTWRVDTPNSYYTKTFTCKWGNETLTWGLKKMSRGGMIDVYFDDKKVGTYSCYSKTSRTTQIVIANNLEKGEHTFKAVFKGPDPSVKYKTKPVMYVGTEKGNVLNLTAKLKGKDVYYAYDEYKSPNTYEAFGKMTAPTLFDDTVTTKSALREKLIEQLNDEPTVELSTNYLGDTFERRYITNEDLKENNLVRFIHKPLHFNVDLKIVKLTKFHPFMGQPVEVEFSNAKKDIIDIQNQIDLRMKRATNSIANGNWNVNKNVKSNYFTDVVGSVLSDG